MAFAKNKKYVDPETNKTYTYVAEDRSYVYFRGEEGDISSWTVSTAEGLYLAPKSQKARLLDCMKDLCIHKNRLDFFKETLEKHKLLVEGGDEQTR